MFSWFILYTTQQKWQKKKRWILLLYQHFTSDFLIQNNFITMAKSMRKIIEHHGGCEQDFGKMFHDPKTRVFFWCLLLSRTGDCHHTHMRTMVHGIFTYMTGWFWTRANVAKYSSTMMEHMGYGPREIRNLRTSTDHGRQWSWTLLSFVHQSVNTVGKPMS